MKESPPEIPAAPAMARMSHKMFYGGAFWFCCIVLTADMIIPTNVAMGLWYILPVMLGLMAPAKAYILITASASTLLIVLGHLVSPILGETWVGATNRGFSILTLWVIAWLCLKLRGQFNPAS